jgi:hypothetical protein
MENWPTKGRGGAPDGAEMSGGATLGRGRARWATVLGGAERAGERDEARSVRSDTEGPEPCDEDREGPSRLALR